MISLFRNSPQRGSVCHRCRFIRYFLLVALGIGIFALVGENKAHYLLELTPARAVTGIFAIGIIGFFVKLVIWRLEIAGKNKAHQDKTRPSKAPSPGNAP